jgi:hypothetical protein
MIELMKSLYWYEYIFITMCLFIFFTFLRKWQIKN